MEIDFGTKPCGCPRRPGTMDLNPTFGDICGTHSDIDFDEVFADIRDNLLPSSSRHTPAVVVRQDEPACWSWPVPEEILMKGRAINDLPADDLPGRFNAAENLLYDWQREHTFVRCAICGGVTLDEVVDHDHATGLIRGLLCPPCNVSEGRSSGSELIRGYRARPPAVILGGFSARYYELFGGWAQPQPMVSQEKLREATDRLRLPSLDPEEQQ